MSSAPEESMPQPSKPPLRFSLAPTRIVFFALPGDVRLPPGPLLPDEKTILIS
jgi:hypothetical protein